MPVDAGSAAGVAVGSPRPRWWIGVDGGGSGTRVRLSNADGRSLGEGQAGPSALGQGVAAAWAAIASAIDQAWDAAGVHGIGRAVRADCALGIGVSGAAHGPWREALLTQAAGHAIVVVDTDIRTRLLGAFGQRPGGVLSAGTGSFAACQDDSGGIRRTGGWGFPVGDEGSGAWIGLRAVRHAQCVLDGRQTPGPLSAAVLAEVRRAGTIAAAAAAAAATDPVAGLRAWCAAAGQQAYAALAPVVFETAPRDPAARALLDAAKAALLDLLRPLDDAAGTLHWVVAGSVAERFAADWPDVLARRLVTPAGDACDGALALVRHAVADGAPRLGGGA